MSDRTVIQNNDLALYHIGATDFTGAVLPLCQAWVSTRRCIVRRESVAAVKATMCPACARLVNGAH